MSIDETVSQSSRSWLYLMSAVTALFLILPIAMIIPMSFTDAAFLRFPPGQWSFRWYRAFLESEQWRGAARTSIIVALGTVAVATPVGTLAAYGVLTSRSKFANLVWLIVMAPLVVPLVLTAVGLYFLYARLDLNGTWFGLVLAHSMHAVPYVFVTMFSALQGFDLDQPRVAQSLGATPAYAFRTITLPQIKLSLTVAALLAFLSSFDEVVMALFISGGDHVTLPKLMFEDLQFSLDPTIAAASSLMLVVALAVLTVTQLLSKRARS